jgi:hypothetical protein
VEVIIPHPSWKPEYAKALKSYEMLLGKAPALPEEKIPATNRKYQKFTTQLAEIQNLCADLRTQLESGLKPSEIAISAPDIGVYWAALSEYLKIEGIPYQRKIQTPL